MKIVRRSVDQHALGQIRFAIRPALLEPALEYIAKSGSRMAVRGQTLPRPVGGFGESHSGEAALRYGLAEIPRIARSPFTHGSSLRAQTRVELPKPKIARGELQDVSGRVAEVDRLGSVAPLHPFDNLDAAGGKHRLLLGK